LGISLQISAVREHSTIATNHERKPFGAVLGHLHAAPPVVDITSDADCGPLPVSTLTPKRMTDDEWQTSVTAQAHVAGILLRKYSIATDK
jgi:hypothetical protein